MFAVIFRANIKQSDSEYGSLAKQLRKLALTEYGCCEFVSAQENGLEIAISYWNTLEDIRRWKQDKLHRHAQKLGAERWYSSYQVDLVECLRSYQG